jgi:5-formyltetrahydrofolate cyclo-ligase
VTDKKELRAWAKAQRAQLPDVSTAVSRLLAAWLPADATVLAYRAFGTEIDLFALIAARPDVRWLVTRVDPDQTLSLHPWDAPSARTRWGVDEPLADCMPTHEVPDVVLCPGLAFDRAGHRLGYGQGHFDRLLAGLAHAVRIGIVHAALVVDALPHEPHDIAMTHLATEHSVVPFA